MHAQSVCLYSLCRFDDWPKHLGFNHSSLLLLLVTVSYFMYCCCYCSWAVCCSHLLLWGQVSRHGPGGLALLLVRVAVGVAAAAGMEACNSCARLSDKRLLAGDVRGQKGRSLLPPDISS